MIIDHGKLAALKIVTRDYLIHDARSDVVEQRDALRVVGCGGGLFQDGAQELERRRRLALSGFPCGHVRSQLRGINQ